MLKVKIISVGKIKNKDLKNVIDEYEKRLSKYVKLEICCLNDLPLSEKPSPGEISSCLEKEGIEILKKVSDKAFIFTLCVEGKKIDSKALAHKLSDLSQSYSEIDFIIGSSHGICDRVKEKSNFKLSMSDMTFPHNLAKLMLLEQIYRSFKILNNETYHK